MDDKEKENVVLPKTENLVELIPVTKCITGEEIKEVNITVGLQDTDEYYVPEKQPVKLIKPNNAIIQEGIDISTLTGDIYSRQMGKPLRMINENLGVDEKGVYYSINGNKIEVIPVQPTSPNQITTCPSTISKVVIEESVSSVSSDTKNGDTEIETKEFKEKNDNLVNGEFEKDIIGKSELYPDYNNTKNKTEHQEEFNAVNFNSISPISNEEFKKGARNKVGIELVNYIDKHKGNGITVYLPNSKYSVFISEDIKSRSKLSFMYLNLINSKEKNSEDFYSIAKKFEVLRLVFNSLIFNTVVQPTYDEFTKYTSFRDLDIIILSIGLVITKSNKDDKKIVPIYTVSCENPQCSIKNIELAKGYDIDLLEKLKSIYPVKDYAVNALSALNVHSLKDNYKEKNIPKVESIEYNKIIYKIGMTDVTIEKSIEVDKFKSNLVSILVNKIKKLGNALSDLTLDQYEVNNLSNTLIPVTLLKSTRFTVNELLVQVMNLCETAYCNKAELEIIYGETEAAFEELVNENKELDYSESNTYNLAKKMDAFSIINYFLTDTNLLSDVTANLFLYVDIIKIVYPESYGLGEGSIQTIRTIPELYEFVTSTSSDVSLFIENKVVEFNETLNEVKKINVTLKELIDSGSFKLNEDTLVRLNNEIVDLENKIKSIESDESIKTEEIKDLQVLKDELENYNKRKKDIESAFIKMKAGTCQCGMHNYIIDSLDVDFFTLSKVLADS